MSSVEKQLDELKAEIDAEVPADITVSDVTYEGPELVIYTPDPKRFARNGELVRNLASKLRKRITIRPNPDALSAPKTAEDEVLSVIPTKPASPIWISTKTPARSSSKPKNPAL